MPQTPSDPAANSLQEIVEIEETMFVKTVVIYTMPLQLLMILPKKLSLSKHCVCYQHCSKRYLTVH